MRTTVGSMRPRKVPDKDDDRAASKSSELRPDTTAAEKSVGEAAPVVAKETPISKDMSQE